MDSEKTEKVEGDYSDIIDEWNLPSYEKAKERGFTKRMYRALLKGIDECLKQKKTK